MVEEQALVHLTDAVVDFLAGDGYKIHLNLMEGTPKNSCWHVDEP